MDNLTYGKRCEALATSYLKKNGYKIIVNNYKNSIGEIDIIAEDKDDLIIFIEVKGRISRKFGDPVEAVNYYKQQKIIQVATLYLKIKKKLDSSCRFDVISVLGDNDEEIRHIKSAF